MIAIPTHLPEIAKPDLRELDRWKRMLAWAMRHSDDLLVEFEYRDRKGKWSRRVVSPIRFLAKDAFMGLCLSREEPRQFQIEYCRNLILRFAHEYVMPVPMVQLDTPPAISAATFIHSN